MDELTKQTRAEIARLLKAARWLLGAPQPKAGVAEGSVEWKLRELSPAELASRSPLVENDITAPKIARLERMERSATPIELDMIERALGLPGWFDHVRTDPLDPPIELTRRPRARVPIAARLPPLDSRRVAGQ